MQILKETIMEYKDIPKRTMEYIECQIADKENEKAELTGEISQLWAIKNYLLNCVEQAEKK